MSYADPTPEEIHQALANLGTYRVIACQVAAGEGPPDGIGGHHLLVVGLRESWLRNVNGDRDPATGEHRAHGWAQINETYHGDFLRREPGCPVDTWRAVAGHTADEEGFAPRFTPAMLYALGILKSNKARAEREGIAKTLSLRVAFNGYNRGIVGAIRQAKSGRNPDLGTTGDDYGAWCLHNARKVKDWLGAHPHWTP